MASPLCRPAQDNLRVNQGRIRGGSAYLRTAWLLLLLAERVTMPATLNCNKERTERVTEEEMSMETGVN